MIKQRSLAKLIVLSFLTCGIYGFFFWWGFINDVNEVCVCDGKKSPNFLVVMLLSFFTFGIYYLFWLYRQGERLQSIAPEYKLKLKQGGGSVLAQYFFGNVFMSLGSSAGTIAFSISGTYAVSFAGYSDAALREMFSTWNIPADMVLVLALCSLLIYVIGVGMMFNSLKILISHLNTVGQAFNEKCLFTSGRFV